MTVSRLHLIQANTFAISTVFRLDCPGSCAAENLALFYLLYTNIDRDGAICNVRSQTKPHCQKHMQGVLVTTFLS